MPHCYWPATMTMGTVPQEQMGINWHAKQSVGASRLSISTHYSSKKLINDMRVNLSFYNCVGEIRQLNARLILKLFFKSKHVSKATEVKFPI